MNKPHETPIQIGRHKGPFPGLRLINGVINATNDELCESIDSCERAAEWGGIAVIIGLVIEVALAACHPPFDSFAGIWGAVIADSLVALGVAGEVLFSRMGSARQRELQRRSGEKVAEAISRATDAERKTEEEKLSRVQIEQEIIKQLKPRDFTREQFDEIVDEIKGKIKVKLTVFVADDPETFRFGLAIGDLFREAQIDAPFVQLNTSSPQVIGVRFSGMTLYAPGHASNPELKELEALCSLTLAKNGLAIGMYSGPEATQSVPVPSLFIMPKQHPFSWIPAYWVLPELPKPPWEPK
jgi:hypothetical protein